jgi:protein TonB
MSYLDRTADPDRRTIAVTGVIVIHALIGYVLVTGLISTYVPHIRTPFGGEQFPLPPPKPTPEPTKTQVPKATSKPATVPKPALDLSHTDDNHVVEHETDIVEVTPTPTATYTPPLIPRFKPKGASPGNSPASWANTDDYPARDLREGNEGTTVFRALVGTDGRVTGCEIVRSSGHPGLDAATCRAVAPRARFEPATDENGNKVAGSYSNSVLWRIPR